MSTASGFASSISSASVRTSLLSEQVGVCRICLEEVDNRQLLRPCKCSGTQAFVHQLCLDTWLKQRRSRICETCNNEYEMIYKGLKPIKEWTWPSPTSNFWEDQADFVCGFVWALIACRVVFEWMTSGITQFHENLYGVFGSRRLVTIWWFSFAINSLYYQCVLYDVFGRWWNDNSIYTWKNGVPVAASIRNSFQDDDLEQ